MPHGPPRIRLADGTMNVIGRRLKQRRRQIKLTQDALCARVARISSGSWIPTRFDIRRIELGDRTVTDVELIALAAAVEMSLVRLICGVDVEPPIQAFSSETFRGAAAMVETDNHPEDDADN